MENKEEDLYKIGISHKEYIECTNQLTIHGWFLCLDKVKEVELFINNEYITNSLINRFRPDVKNEYPQYDNDRSGFVFELEHLCKTECDIKLKFATTNDVIVEEFKVYPNKEVPAFLNDIKKNGTEILYNVNYPFTLNKIFELISKFEINLDKYNINYADYYKWFNKINYFKNYPNYINEFNFTLERKSLEHYLSIKHLCANIEDEVCLDVASSNSPFPDILKSLGAKKVYKQDLLYPLGLNNNVIGSDASSIPLDDSSVDRIFLHCSIEHFENDSDFRFIEESHRLLKDKGKLCIIPLYLSDKYSVISSPSVYSTKFGSISNPVKFSKDIELLIINEKNKQRQAKFYSIKVLKEQIIDKYADKFKFTITYYDNYHHFNICPMFSLIAEKI